MLSRISIRIECPNPKRVSPYALRKLDIMFTVGGQTGSSQNHFPRNSVENLPTLFSRKYKPAIFFSLSLILSVSSSRKGLAIDGRNPPLLFTVCMLIGTICRVLDFTEKRTLYETVMLPAPPAIGILIKASPNGLVNAIKPGVS